MSSGTSEASAESWPILGFYFTAASATSTTLSSCDDPAFRDRGVPDPAVQLPARRACGVLRPDPGGRENHHGVRAPGEDGQPGAPGDHAVHEAPGPGGLGVGAAGGGCGDAPLAAREQTVETATRRPYAVAASVADRCGGR